MCIPPRSQAPRFASHGGIKFWGVHHTAESSAPNFSKNSEVYILLWTVESSSAVCIWPQCQATWCASHPRVKLRGVHHTVELNYTPRSQNRKFHWSLDAFKGTIRRNPFMGEHIFHERRDLKKNTLPLSHKSHALLSFDKEHCRAMEDLRKI